MYSTLRPTKLSSTFINNSGKPSKVCAEKYKIGDIIAKYSYSFKYSNITKFSMENYL